MGVARTTEPFILAVALIWGSAAVAQEDLPQTAPTQSMEAALSGPTGGSTPPDATSSISPNSAQPESLIDSDSEVAVHRYSSGLMMCATPQGVCPLPSGVTVNVTGYRCYCMIIGPGGQQSFINGQTSR